MSTTILVSKRLLWWRLAFVVAVLHVLFTRFGVPSNCVAALESGSPYQKVGRPRRSRQSRASPTEANANGRPRPRPPSSRGMSSRRYQYEPHPDLHPGYRPGDVYCIQEFPKQPGQPLHMKVKPAEFYLVTDAMLNTNWGLKEADRLRLFFDPEAEAMLLYQRLGQQSNQNTTQGGCRVVVWLSDQVSTDCGI